MSQPCTVDRKSNALPVVPPRHPRHLVALSKTCRDDAGTVLQEETPGQPL